MSAIKKKHFSWAGNQEKNVPSYTLQQYRVSHIKNWVELVVNYVVLIPFW